MYLSDWRAPWYRGVQLRTMSYLPLYTMFYILCHVDIRLWTPKGQSKRNNPQKLATRRDNQKGNNPQKLATRKGNQKGTIHRNWQYWVHKTQDGNKQNKQNKLTCVVLSIKNLSAGTVSAHWYLSSCVVLFHLSLIWYYMTHWCCFLSFW